MTLKEFKQELLEKSLAAGCEAAEVYCTEGESFTVGTLEGDIEKYKVANTRSLSLRVVYDGQDGFAATEVFENADELVRSAMDNAKSITSEDFHPMQGASEYQSVETPHQPLFDLNARERIELARNIEARAKASDERVKRTTGCSVSVIQNTTTLANTLGLSAQHMEKLGTISLGLVTSDGTDEKMSGDYFFGSDTRDISHIIDEVVQDGIMKLGASPVPPGEYKVLFTAKAFCDMLDLFSSIFSAYAAQKGMSLLAGKEGSMIASECVTLCDDPFYAEYPIPFDMEGVPTFCKNLIENGKLITLIHSLQTAKAENKTTTGNGTRSGGCAFTNVYIKPSTQSFENLVSGEKVLVLSELDGAGTGVNEISGDFSLSAKGGLYENGVRVRAVNQITAAGNFYELLKRITAVGDKLEFVSAYNSGAMGFLGSPCVLVDGLMISG